MIPNDAFGRVLYMRSYMANLDKRLIGAMLSGLTSMAIFVIAVIGVVRAWLAAQPMGSSQ